MSLINAANWNRWTRSVGVALFVFAGTAAAVELGSLQAQSYLHEAVKLRVPIGGLNPADFGNLQVSLAGLRHYGERNLRPEILASDVRLRIQGTPTDPWIEVRTLKPLHEPLSYLLLETRIGTFREIHELALLLELAPVTPGRPAATRKKALPDSGESGTTPAAGTDGREIQSHPEALAGQHPEHWFRLDTRLSAAAGDRRPSAPPAGGTSPRTATSRHHSSGLSAQLSLPAWSVALAGLNVVLLLIAVAMLVRREAAAAEVDFAEIAGAAPQPRAQVLASDVTGRNATDEPGAAPLQRNEGAQTFNMRLLRHRLKILCSVPDADANRPEITEAEHLLDAGRFAEAEARLRALEQQILPVSRFGSLASG